MNLEKHKEHFRKFKEDPEYRKEHIVKMEELRKDYWQTLKPFITEQDVPLLPNPLTEFYLNKLIELGAITKDKLEDDVWYYGNYRNSTLGKWNAEKQEFGHWRYKFGYRWDSCNHFQNENGFALFVPLRKANETELNEVNQIKTLVVYK